MVCMRLCTRVDISISSPAGVTGVRLWVLDMPFIEAVFVGFGSADGLVRRLKFTS